MNLVRKTSCVLLAGLISLAAMTASAANPRETLQRFYDNVDRFSAGFSQVSTDDRGTVLDESHGRLILDRPDRFFWDYEAPFRQQIVSDGAKVWMYDQDLAQVTVKRLDDTVNGTPAALLSGQNLDSSFTLSSELEGNREWVVLTPRSQDTDFSKIRMSFIGDLPEIMELRDQFQNITRIQFDGIDVNPSIARGMFDFSPPPNAEVVGD